jgi:hypothetical protein
MFAPGRSASRGHTPTATSPRIRRGIRRGIRSQGLLQGVRAGGSAPEGPCQSVLARASLPEGPRRRVRAGGSAPEGPRRRVRAGASVPEGPCQRVRSRGSVPEGPRQGPPQSVPGETDGRSQCGGQHGTHAAQVIAVRDRLASPDPRRKKPTSGRRPCDRIYHYNLAAGGIWHRRAEVGPAAVEYLWQDGKRPARRSPADFVSSPK